MSDTNIWDAELDLIERTLNGPHKGWETLSIEMEGTRFQKIHDIITIQNFDLDAENSCNDTIDELVDLAQTAGHADADNYENMSTTDNEEQNAIIQHTSMMLQNPANNLYFKLVHSSEQIILNAARTPEARNFLGPKHNNHPGIIFSKMLTAYQDGIHTRLAPAGPKL